MPVPAAPDQPAPGVVLRVRWAWTRPVSEVLPALTPDERDRVAAAPPRRQDAVATALLLARVLAAEACGAAAADVRVGRRCPACGSTAHGAPLARRADGGPVPRVSLGRADDLVVAAAADVPVGVDVEPRAAPRGPGRLAEVVLADGEPPAPGPDGLLRSWVRKEAVLKAAGTGLAVDPRALRVDDVAGRPAVRHAPDALPLPPGARWWLTDLALAGDGGAHLVGLAALLPDHTSPTVDVREADLLP